MPFMRRYPLHIGLFAAMLLTAPCAAADVDFAHEVLPLLRKHCATCHTDGTFKGSLSLDTRETLVDSGVVTPGSSDASHLVDRITSDDPDVRMPPEGPRLSAAEVEIMRRWIDADLPWEAGFSFRAVRYRAPLKPRRPDVPPAEAGLENPIDRIVARYWRERGISPPPLLDDAAFMRRASLDLVGLLPEPAAVEAFVADADPHKRQQLVARLLDDRVAYADHWLTFWNDLLRNDYAGAGYIDGGRQQITAWLYPALLANKPYDAFVRELIAPTAESAGFSKGIVWRGAVNASQRPELQFAQNVGQVFLGVNLKCASCHDSFIDDWKLTDSYGLAAIIADEPLEIHRCDKPTGQTAEAYFLFPELGGIDPAAARDDRLRRLADLMVHADNGRLARTIVNRLWARLMGRGIVHPVDSMDAQPWDADLLDFLAVHLTDSGYDLKQTLQLIASSRVYGSAAAAAVEGENGTDFVFRGAAVKRMTAEQFLDAASQLTGVAPPRTANDEVFIKSAEAFRGGSPRPFVRASLVASTPLMLALGRPSREQVVTTRPAEVTTLEALELSNGEALAALVETGAQELLKRDADLRTDQRCRAIFRAALAREPSAAELADLSELAGDPLTAEGFADALWCILMLPEFQLIR